MIQGLEDEPIVGPELRREHLNDYWREYFAYEERGEELFELTKTELLTLIASSKQEAQPHIDSQILVNELLTKLGPRHPFHRQFRDQFPDMHPTQVLGMQLFALLVADSEIWRHMKKPRLGNVFSHSHYFITA